MPTLSALQLTLRPATSSDIPTLTTLILTSFHTFPLFAHLYAPLLRNPAVHAPETASHWDARLRDALASSAASVIVAEVERRDLVGWVESAKQQQQQDWREGHESQAMGTLPEQFLRAREEENEVPSKGKAVVGFALWRWKGGLVDEKKGFGWLNRSWTEYFFSLYSKCKIHCYDKLYIRKDLVPEEYAIYEKSEDAHLEKHYPAGFQCLNLDNLCVDFRVQNQGFGRSLVQWGIDQSRRRSIAIKTETNSENVQFYQKLGFEHLDDWMIPTTDLSKTIRLVVLGHEPTQDM